LIIIQISPKRTPVLESDKRVVHTVSGLLWIELESFFMRSVRRAHENFI